MKSVLLSFVLLAGLNAMACDQLLGTWQCQGNAGNTQDTYEKIAGGIKVTSISDGGSTSIILLDGAQHSADLGGAQMSYSGSMTCTSSEKASLSLKAQVSTPGGQSSGLSMIGVFTVHANQLQTDTTATMSDGRSSVAHVSCTKM